MPNNSITVQPQKFRHPKIAVIILKLDFTTELAQKM